MEAYGSVLVDQGLYTKRNNSPVPVFSSSCNSDNSVFMHRSAIQQLLSCHGAVFPGTRPPLYAASPLPAAPTYWSSLPPPRLLQQPSCPPLLPLPLSRSFSLPSPSTPVSARRATGIAAARSANKDQRKPRSPPVKGPQPGGARPHKEPPAVPRSAAATTSPLKGIGAAKGGCDFPSDVYALSPPPSSLPMPKFSLRARTPSTSPQSSSCDGEALGGAAGGVDAGASDDLRQLLRL